MSWKTSLPILIVAIILMEFVSCAGDAESSRELSNAAMVKILSGDREALEFEAELFAAVDTLYPKAGDTLEAVFGNQQTARIVVKEYESSSGYLLLQFTEQGMVTNFDDYIIGGKYLEIRPDPNAVRQTGSASSIDS